ncbi:hypothetical protein [Pseudomonas putida]|uniref:Uncharacterized protein n=1 Tax=Pseudomonas putida TaxID=303 RepID=A0A8I1JGP9_PSEPU|nr:hypothetical protein [Pseudomonas putida]MBI6883027.1 hypothetical protein [Pseudomonas putida]
MKPQTKGAKFTAKAFAELHELTVGTARRRLQKLVDEGKATAAHNCQQPIPRKRYSGHMPPYTYVTIYTIFDQDEPKEAK